MSLDARLLESITCKDIVIFAGGGLSMKAPSLLPGWYPFQKKIFSCLCDRYEILLDTPNYLAPIRTLLDTDWQQGYFPPEYQAQLLYEHCGDAYSGLLQSIDVSVINENHEALARFSATGRVKAIVTTNIDRLIETALIDHDVAYTASYDAETYEACSHRLSQPTPARHVEIIKIHGCVQDRLSLVDTLKQRLQGRNRFLDRSIATLLTQYVFLYTGFSARDIELDSEFLGLKKAPSKSHGLVYVQWPGSPELSQGAAILMSAYGKKSQLITADCADVFNCLALDEDSDESEPLDDIVNTGFQGVEQALVKNTRRLSTATVSTCLAALLEANGQTCSAYETLQHCWHSLLSRQGAEPGIDRFQLLYGRLGLALGQVSMSVPSAGSRSEAGMQNLARLNVDDRRMEAWSGLAMAWQAHTDLGYRCMLTSYEHTVEQGEPLEHQMDCWFALAEYYFFTAEGVDAFDNWYKLLAMAENSADLARTARLSAMVYLHLCDRKNCVTEAHHVYQQVLRPRVFSQSERLNDPISEGLVSLARARWFNHRNDSQNASEAIVVAMQKLSQAAMVRWYEFARLERSNILIEQLRTDEAARLLTSIKGQVADYALLQPRFHAVCARLHSVNKQADAAFDAYRSAISACEKLGMDRWRLEYEKAVEQMQEPLS